MDPLIKDLKAYATIIAAYAVAAGVAGKALIRSRSFNRAAWWPSARGRILESVLYQDAARKGATHFRVRYEFKVDGQQIEGSTPRLCGDWFWNNQQQAAFVDRFQPGQEVEVFYDPLKPATNCLDRADRSGLAALWVLAGGTFAVASVLVWILWREHHQAG
jgi:hypothetical protein